MAKVKGGQQCEVARYPAPKLTDLLVHYLMPGSRVSVTAKPLLTNLLVQYLTLLAYYVHSRINGRMQRI